MKIKSALLLLSLIGLAPLFGKSNFDKFKEESKKEESQESCPLNEKQERRVYEWFKKNVHDFDSLEILGWSPIHKVKKGLFQSKDPGLINVKVLIRGKTLGGGTTKKAIAFMMDENGYNHSVFAVDGYFTVDLDATTVDMTTGELKY